MLYEGKPVGTPDAGAFWRVVAEHGVQALFTAPTAFRAIKKEDPDGRLLRGVRPVAPAARCSSPASGSTRTPTQWATERLGVPVDRPLVADRDRLADRGQPARAGADADQARLAHACRCPATTCGCSTRPAPRCRRAPRARSASGCRCRPGTLPTLWRDDERYVASYLSAFDGYYLTGDGGYVDEDGYLFVMGRTDDVINVAGHRLSTGSMEAVLAGHPAVAECAVIGVHDELKGQVPRGLVVLKAGVDVDPDAARAPSWCSGCATRSGRSRRSGRSTSSPALPKTRSGQDPARARCARIADGATSRCRRTIEDPAVLDALRPVLQT